MHKAEIVVTKDNEIVDRCNYLSEAEEKAKELNSMDFNQVKKWIRDNFGQEAEKQCADSMRNADAGKYFDLVTDWNSLSEEEKKAEFIRGCGGEG